MGTWENTGLRVLVADTAAEFLAAVPDPDPEDPADLEDRPHVIRIGAGLWQPGPGGGRGTGPDAVPPAGADPVVRPTWIHWTSPAGRMADRENRRLRRRTIEASQYLASLTSEIHSPIPPDVFEEWYQLYRAHIGRLRTGRNMAGLFRSDILDPATGHELRLWRRDGELVCGSVLWTDHQHEAFVQRFYAVAETESHAELPRGMFSVADTLAAERGQRWFTAGNDVNITGALISPGLAAYKWRLGLRPVPADLFGTPSEDIAERVLSLHGLQPPLLRFVYRRPRPAVPDIADFVDGDDQLELVSVSPPEFAGQVLSSLPKHQRLVLEAVAA